jgi:hypothetical protein
MDRQKRWGCLGSREILLNRFPALFVYECGEPMRKVQTHSQRNLLGKQRGFQQPPGSSFFILSEN